MIASLTPEDPEFDSRGVEQNSLGLAAFIVSIVGLFSAGTLSLIGLILGAIAMRREPKGFAIAGFVIGLIGTLLGCIVATIFFVVISAAGMGLTAGILSIVYSQIEEGVNGIDAASLVIVEWEERHNGSLPTAEVGTAALEAAGISASYRLIDSDEFELELVIDKNGDPWTFSAKFEADGDRKSLRWKSGSGHSHGNWNF